MKKLDLLNLDGVSRLEQPQNHVDLTLHSSALEFMTDFTKIKPLVIESDLTAIETRTLMTKAHVRLKIVLNSEGEFIGLVSANDLIDRKITQKVAEGEKRGEISIMDFMVPKHKLRALNYNQVKQSNISDVIDALKEYGKQHCLIVDSDANSVRGIFSVSDISRKLHLALDIQDQPSFSKLASTLD